MHLIIGFLTALAGLIWAVVALQRAGLDLASLNPFAWARRRRWRKLYGTKPLYNLKHPMEAAAALIVGLLKQEGEISREQKAAVLDIFETEFKLSAEKAMEAFTSSAYLVRDEINLDQSVKNILTPSLDKFSQDQRLSLLQLLERVASLEGPISESQHRVITAVRGVFSELSPSYGK